MSKRRRIVLIIVLNFTCGVILDVTYEGRGKVRGVYLFGWYNGIWSFDTLVGCGVILEDTWCIIGRILYSGVDALEQGVKFCQKRNSLTS